LVYADFALRKLMTVTDYRFCGRSSATGTPGEHLVRPAM
jgi:hypothetical protein